jgi:hypothetical protein
MKSPKRSWFYIIMGMLCWRRVWEFMARAAAEDEGIQDRFVVLTWSIVFITIWVVRYI